MSLAYIIAKGLQAIAPSDGYDVAHELAMLNQPAQVYEMNSEEMSKLEHTLTDPQSNPKKKVDSKKMEAIYNIAPGHRDYKQREEDAKIMRTEGGMTKAGIDATWRAYNDPTDEMHDFVKEMIDGPANDHPKTSGMSPPEYLRNKLDKIGYNSWSDLVKDYSSTDVNTLYKLGHKIMDENSINVDTKLYETVINIYNYIVDNKLPVDKELTSKIITDLVQIYFVGISKKNKNLMIKSTETDLKYEPRNRAIQKTLELLKAP